MAPWTVGERGAGEARPSCDLMFLLLWEGREEAHGVNAVPEVTQARNKTGPKSSATFSFLLCQQPSQVATGDSGVVPRVSMSAFLKCAGSQAVGGSCGCFFPPRYALCLRSVRSVFPESEIS